MELLSWPELPIVQSRSNDGSFLCDADANVADFIATGDVGVCGPDAGA